MFHWICAYNSLEYMYNSIALIYSIIDMKANNTELNNLRKMISWRKFEVSVERISVCNVIENFAEHGIHFQPCSCANDVIDMLPNNYGVILMSE